MAKASDADFALHRAIIESVKHRRLRDQDRQVEQQVRLYINSSNEQIACNLPAIVMQHDRLMDTLLARDAVRAAEEAWKHYEARKVNSLPPYATSRR